MITSKHRVAAAVAAALFLGQAAAAATIGISGVTVTNVRSQTDANLTLGIGGLQPSTPGFETGSTPAETKVTIPFNPNTGNKFEATSKQAPNGDASIQYDGQWITDSKNNTEFFGFSELNFKVKNESALPFFGRYGFKIDQAFIDLEGSTNNNGDPFKNGPLTAGLGVTLRHFVAVDNKIVSDLSFKMWTVYESGNSNDILVRTENKGISLATKKNFVIDPDGQRFDLGWDADLVSPILGSAELGRFEIGDEKNVTVRMEMFAIQASETRIFAKISDPGLLDARIFAGAPTPPPSPVPLPAAAWMLLAALASLGVFRRFAA